MQETQTDTHASILPSPFLTLFYCTDCDISDATGVPMVTAAYIDDSERPQPAPLAAGYNTPSSVVAIAHPHSHPQQQLHEPMSTVPAPNQSHNINGPQAHGYASPHNHGNYPPPQQQQQHTPAFAGQRPPQYHLGKFGL